MPDDDPWGYGSKIVPGHPLYGNTRGQVVIEKVLMDMGIPHLSAERGARAIIRALVVDSPPLFLVTEAEMKGEGG